MQLTIEQQAQLLDLARFTIRESLGQTGIAAVQLTDPAFAQPAGCFVTLHTLADHRLRGCIGQLQASGPLRDSVVEMAQAVLDDPRFRDRRVTPDELPQLDLEITILSPSVLAADVHDFDLLQHGIYLRCDGETGCFLPQVARETGWTKDQLLTRLCTEKMGLDPDAWQRAEARLFRFTTLIVGPRPFVDGPNPQTCRAF